MPLFWKKGHNPYKKNFFRILELGAGAPVNLIPAKRKEIIKKIRANRKQEIDDHKITEEEVFEAANCLSVSEGWANEVLLTHPIVKIDKKNVNQIRDKIKKEMLNFATEPHEPSPKWGNKGALAFFAPTPNAQDCPKPHWSEFNIIAPDSSEDQNLDIRYDM